MFYVGITAIRKSSFAFEFVAFALVFLAVLLCFPWSDEQTIPPDVHGLFAFALLFFLLNGTVLVHAFVGVRYCVFME